MKNGEEEKKGRWNVTREKEERSQRLLNQCPEPVLRLASSLYSLSARAAVLFGDFGLQVKENPSQTTLSKTELKLVNQQSKQKQKTCVGSTGRGKGRLREQLHAWTSVVSPGCGFRLHSPSSASHRTGRALGASVSTKVAAAPAFPGQRQSHWGRGPVSPLSHRPRLALSTHARLPTTHVQSTRPESRGAEFHRGCSYVDCCRGGPSGGPPRGPSVLCTGRGIGAGEAGLPRDTHSLAGCWREGTAGRPS